jgi:signal transduction histidine kinase
MAPEMIATSTILIVDDNPTNLELLLKNFDQIGFKVLVAKDGPGALKRLQYAKPDLILLDIMMPGMNGIEVCRQLKTDKATQDIPIIFMSALDDVDNKIKGFEAGAVDYITKPFQQEEVVARITTHLTLRLLQRHLQTQNEELTRLNNELAERNQELDAFAHTVAHDLKNPVGMIINFAELIAGEVKLPEDTQRQLGLIARAARKMNNIVNELLLMAGMRRTEVEQYPLNMARIVGEARQRLSYMIEEREAELILPADWPVAVGHAPWVEEVWANYLSNGLKYGGQPPRLHLGAAANPDGMVRFWVRDNGPGLSSEQQTHLFTEFTRLNQIKTEGHGLGLSIARRIVEKLGGQVGVESEGIPGRGCTFFFTLPQAIEAVNSR